MASTPAPPGMSPPGLASLPPELLDLLLRFGEGHAVLNLWKCGCTALNFRLAAGGCTQVALKDRSALSTSRWPKLLSQLRYLRSFSIIREKNKIDTAEALLQGLFSLSPTLTELILECEEIELILRGSLGSSSESSIDERSRHTLAEAFPNLLSLTINGRIALSGFLFGSELPPRLEHLVVRSPIKLLENIHLLPRGLKTLHLTDGTINWALPDVQGLPPTLTSLLLRHGIRFVKNPDETKACFDALPESLTEFRGCIDAGGVSCSSDFLYLLPSFPSRLLFCFLLGQMRHVDKRLLQMLPKRVGTLWMSADIDWSGIGASDFSSELEELTFSSSADLFPQKQYVLSQIFHRGWPSSLTILKFDDLPIRLAHQMRDFPPGLITLTLHVIVSIPQDSIVHPLAVECFPQTLKNFFFRSSNLAQAGGIEHVIDLSKMPKSLQSLIIQVNPADFLDKSNIFNNRGLELPLLEHFELTSRRGTLPEWSSVFYLPSLRSLQLEMVAITPSLLQFLPKLEDLQVVTQTAVSGPEVVMFLPRTLTALRWYHLRLPGRWLHRLPRTLRKLAIDGITEFEVAHLQALPPKLRDLEAYDSECVGPDPGPEDWRLLPSSLAEARMGKFNSIWHEAKAHRKIE